MGIKQLAGHAEMCVRMKLRKDQRDLIKRGDRLTIEQTHNIMARIERGQATLVWLQRLKSTQGDYPLPDRRPDWRRDIVGKQED